MLQENFLGWAPSLYPVLSRWHFRAMCHFHALLMHIRRPELAAASASRSAICLLIQCIWEVMPITLAQRTWRTEYTVPDTVTVLLIHSFMFRSAFCWLYLPSSSYLELWPVALSYKLDLHNVKMNHHHRYVSMSEVIFFKSCHLDTDTYS